MASVNTIVTYYIGSYLQSLSDHIVDNIYTIGGTPILDKRNILAQIYSRDEDFPYAKPGQLIIAIRNSNRKIWTPSLPVNCMIDIILTKNVTTNEVNVETDLLNDANEYYIHKLIDLDSTTQESILPDNTTEYQQFRAAVSGINSIESTGLSVEEVKGSETSNILIRDSINLRIRNRSQQY